MRVRVAIGADHGGFILKGIIARYLSDRGLEVLDYGAQSAEPSDYPDYARAVSDAVRSGKADRGVIVCGSGVGASIAANKFPGIRAAVCHDCFSAHQGVEDDDMNVLCLGERIIGPELAKEVVESFLAAGFSGAERHVRRLGKVNKIEREFMKSS